MVVSKQMSALRYLHVPVLSAHLLFRSERMCGSSVKFSINPLEKNESHTHILKRPKPSTFIGKVPNRYTPPFQ